MTDAERIAAEIDDALAERVALQTIQIAALEKQLAVERTARGEAELESEQRASRADELKKQLAERSRLAEEMEVAWRAECDKRDEAIAAERAVREKAEIDAKWAEDALEKAKVEWRASEERAEKAEREVVRLNGIADAQDRLRQNAEAAREKAKRGRAVVQTTCAEYEQRLAVVEPLAAKVAGLMGGYGVESGPPLEFYPRVIAKLERDLAAAAHGRDLHVVDGEISVCSDAGAAALDKYTAGAVLAEREACAKLVENDDADPWLTLMADLKAEYDLFAGGGIPHNQRLRALAVLLAGAPVLLATLIRARGAATSQDGGRPTDGLCMHGRPFGDCCGDPLPDSSRPTDEAGHE